MQDHEPFRPSRDLTNITGRQPDCKPHQPWPCATPRLHPGCRECTNDVSRGCLRDGRLRSGAGTDGDYARAAPKGTEAARRLDIGRTMVKSVTQGHLPVCFHGNGPLLPLNGP